MDALDLDKLSTNLARYHTLLSKITTVSQLTKLQSAIENEQSSTARQLDAFLQPSHTNTNQAVRTLELNRARLTQTLSKLHHALESVAESKQLALQVSTRIRAVDRERQLVTRVLQFVSHVTSLRQNIFMVHQAIDRSDYKLAAAGIDTILKLPEESVYSEFARRVVPSAEIPEDPQDLLKQWINQLAQVFHDSFVKAAREQDITQLTAVFQLFPLIRKSDMGLDLYSKYVCDMIATQSRKVMTSTTSKSPGFFAQALLHLFKIVSTIINEHSKIIAKYYGKQHMVHIMAKVQREADMQAGLVLDSFFESRNFKEILQDIRAFKENVSPEEEGLTSNAPSMSEVSGIINESSSILQNWSMYCRFFALKWREFSDQSSEDPLTLPAPICDGIFYSKIHSSGFLSDLKKLNEFYLNRSFKKSLELEELPSLNEQISKAPLKHDDISSYAFSSIIEDLTVLIRSCLVVNVNTGESTLLGQFLDMLVRFLQNEYLIRFLQHRLRQLQPRLTSNVVLKKYVPQTESTMNSRAASPGAVEQSKLSHLRFNFKGAATSAFSNIQSNLQAVYADEETVLKLHQYLIYLNTLSIGCVFLQKLLTKELLQDNPQLLPDNFPFGDKSQSLVKKIEATEQTLLAQSSKLLQWGVRLLFDGVLQSKIQKILGPLFTQGTETEYLASTANFEDMSHLKQFSDGWLETMNPYINVLYKDCYAQLLTYAVDFLVAQISPRLWSLKLNELGSIKLDRELGALIAIVCGEHYILREKFTKLTQIVLIAGFEDDDFDSETSDLKEEVIKGISWVLNPTERIRAGELRVDRRH